MNRRRETTRKRRYRGGNGEATAAAVGQPERSALGKLWNAVTAPVTWLASKFTRKANGANSAGMAAAANIQLNPGSNTVRAAAANNQRAAATNAQRAAGENPSSNTPQPPSLNPPQGQNLAPNPSSPSSSGGRRRMRKMSKKHRKSSRKHRKH